MQVVLTSAAQALDWYEAQAPGITRRFIDELETLVGRLAANPGLFPRIRGETSRAGFRRFPYGLFFQIHDGTVVVIACFHASRDPTHWQRRA
jgi:toxin ParE1/3/4